MKHKVCFLLFVSVFVSRNTAVSRADDAVVAEEAPFLPPMPVEIAFRGPNFPNAKEVVITNKNVYDYVFEKAPSDWCRSAAKAVGQ